MKIIGQVSAPGSDNVGVILSDWSDRIGKGFLVLVTDGDKKQQILLTKTSVQTLIPLLTQAMQEMDS